MEQTDAVLAAKVKELAAQAPADRRRMYFQETFGGLGPPIRNYEVVGGFGTRKAAAASTLSMAT